MESSGGMLASEAATVAASEARIEIVGERRRVHDAAFRARVVEECLASGARVQDLARRHGICTSLIYRWRRSALPKQAVVAEVRSGAAGPTQPGKPMVAGPPLEFMPIGVLGRSEEAAPALVTVPSPAGMTVPPSPGPVPLPRPAMEDRPGVIEIDLAHGTRLRVLAVLRATT